jgi:hypothetical protein
MKTAAGRKRSREEAVRSSKGSTPPASPPRPNPNKEWKKSKVKTEDLLALVNRAEPAVTASTEEPAATQAEEEAPAEAGLVDIASILGAPTVTVVRSSLYVKIFPE